MIYVIVSKEDGKPWSSCKRKVNAYETEKRALYAMRLHCVPEEYYEVRAFDVARADSDRSVVVTQTIRQIDEYGYVEDYAIRISAIDSEGNYAMRSIDISEGETEDMTLGRDLNDAYYIADAMRLAYEWGLSGMKVDFENVVVGPEEDDY